MLFQISVSPTHGQLLKANSIKQSKNSHEWHPKSSSPFVKLDSKVKNIED